MSSIALDTKPQTNQLQTINNYAFDTSMNKQLVNEPKEDISQQTAANVARAAANNLLAVYNRHGSRGEVYENEASRIAYNVLDKYVVQDTGAFFTINRNNLNLILNELRRLGDEDALGISTDLVVNRLIKNLESQKPSDSLL